MRQFVFSVCLLLAMVGPAAPARAQDYPPVEIFAGFSVYDSQETVYGWQASASANVHELVGLVADFGGHYSDEFGDVHQYLFGPRIRTPRARVVGFGHALVGVQRFSTSIGGINALAMGIGGGADVVVNDSISIRMVQFDWLPFRIADTWFWTDTYRYGFGVVFGVGGN